MTIGKKDASFHGAANLDAYDFIKTASYPDIAFAFLKRNPKYVRDANARQTKLFVLPDYAGVPVFRASEPCPVGRRWGLNFLVDPTAAIADAAVFWTLDPSPMTLHISLEKRQPPVYPHPLFEPRFCPRFFVDADGNRFLYLTAGRDISCLAVSETDNSDSKLVLTLDGKTSLKDLARFLSEVSSKPTEASAPPGDTGWPLERLRLRSALAAFDCDQQGGSYRDIATLLYGHERTAEAWLSPSTFLKERARRAVRRGRDLVSGGYRSLISGLRVSEKP